MLHWPQLTESRPGDMFATMANTVGLTIQNMTGLDPQHVAWVIEYVKDFKPRRASTVVGWSPDGAYAVRDKPEVQAAVYRILQHRLDDSHIDAAWALSEAADNHYLAREAGNISASNTALGLVMKHRAVNAFAADEVHIATSQEITDRLARGRKRMNQQNQSTDDAEEVSFF